MFLLFYRCYYALSIAIICFVLSIPSIKAQNGFQGTNVFGASAMGGGQMIGDPYLGATGNMMSYGAAPVQNSQQMPLANMDAGVYGAYSYVMKKDFFHITTNPGFYVLDSNDKNILARVNPQYASSSSNGFYQASIEPQDKFSSDAQFGRLLQSPAFLAPESGNVLANINGRESGTTATGANGAVYTINYFNKNAEGYWFMDTASLYQQQTGRFDTRRSYVLTLNNGYKVNIQSNTWRTETTFFGASGEQLAKVTISPLSFVWKTTYKISGQKISPFVVVACMAAMVSN